MSRPTRDIKALTTMRPKRDWHEDYGDVLWWTTPVTEAPYCGSPLCDDWPGYHKWWTPLPNVTCRVRKEAISPEAGVR